VFTLQGGIVAYLAWMGTEIKEGRKDRTESLFKGRNYVFDARGSTGLDSAYAESEKMAECHCCGIPEDRLGKCKTPWCHLVLVLCEECEHGGGVACCDDCEHVDLKPAPGLAKSLCRCEAERERQLWGQSGHQLGRMRRIKGKVQDF
jgi:predicted sulfurtransferase